VALSQALEALPLEMTKDDDEAEDAPTLYEIESHRVLRRLQILREWSHEQDQQIFT